MTVALFHGMFRSLRWPKRFHVMVRGSNFILKLGEDAEPVVGFYTNRWVDAFDPREAEAKAFASVKSKLREKGYEKTLERLELTASEIKEVKFWIERWSKTQGFVFYPKGDK
jgi:hypothetical protein